MGTAKDSEKTRKKLIKAAGELFAQRGFDGVTVRDIISKAKTSLNAMNYHFHTKRGLYRQVLLEACKATSISPEDQEQLLKLDPKKALQIIVCESLKEYKKQKASNWRIVLITRETWQPSVFFEEVTKQYFKPETDFISQIVGKIVNQPEDSKQVRFAVISLIGLLETFGLYGHLIDAVAPGLSGYSRKKDAFARQITQLVIEAASRTLKNRKK